MIETIVAHLLVTLLAGCAAMLLPKWSFTKRHMSQMALDLTQAALATYATVFAIMAIGQMIANPSMWLPINLFR